MIMYQRMHRDEKYQIHATGLCVAVTFALHMGLEHLLTVLPWINICSLAGSTVVHSMRARPRVDLDYDQTQLSFEKGLEV
jgi:hypothetical protein